jgi:hypothetical protein
MAVARRALSQQSVAFGRCNIGTLWRLSAADHRLQGEVDLFDRAGHVLRDHRGTAGRNRMRLVFRRGVQLPPGDQADAKY